MHMSITEESAGTDNTRDFWSAPVLRSRLSRPEAASSLTAEGGPAERSDDGALDQGASTPDPLSREANPIPMLAGLASMNC